MSEEERDREFLGHMREATARIREYLGDMTEAAFLESPMVQDAVIRNIEIIGEAAGRVSLSFRRAHPEIPWRDIAGMRNRLIHGYMRVNMRTV